jgi:APA family basic amino acid/polyamine antiporter
VLGATACLAARCVELSARIVSVIVLIRLGVILLVIGFGASYVSLHHYHWTPFVPTNTDTWGEYGWSEVLRGAVPVHLRTVHRRIRPLSKGAPNDQTDCS